MPRFFRLALRSAIRAALGLRLMGLGGGGGGGGATLLGEVRTACRGAFGCVGSASLRTILHTLMNFLALLAWFSRLGSPLVFFGNFAMSSFFESLTRFPLTSLVTLKPRFLTFSLSFSYSI